MKYSISNPPTIYLKNPKALEAWKNKYRERRRERDKRRRKGTQAVQVQSLPCASLAARMWWTGYRRATRKGVEFKLTREWIRLKIASGTCEVTGIAFDYSVGQRSMKPFAPSLDRKDVTKGYTDANVQVVVCIHNQARGCWGDVPLKKYIGQYLKHLKIKAGL